MTITLAFLLLAACGAREGHEANVVEKMAIFSLISLTAFALIAISFSGGKGGKEAPHRLTAAELTSYPVYVRDSRTSFYKMAFLADGTFQLSSAVTSNGVDPPAAPAGAWTLVSDGEDRIVLTVAGSARTYICVGHDEDTATSRMQSDSGVVETWYFGPHSLVNAQAYCFGRSASMPIEDLRKEA